MTYKQLIKPISISLENENLLYTFCDKKVVLKSWSVWKVRPHRLDPLKDTPKICKLSKLFHTVFGKKNVSAQNATNVFIQVHFLKKKPMA